MSKRQNSISRYDQNSVTDRAQSKPKPLCKGTKWMAGNKNTNTMFRKTSHPNKIPFT